MHALMNAKGWLVSLRKRRAARTGNRAQRGMTLLEILIVLAILGLVMGLLIGPRLMSMFGEAEGKLAQAEVKKYAFEAYTRWSMSNPGQGCPSSLNDLAKYLDKKDAKDPWGNEYVMRCGDNAPEGGGRFGVESKGPDGKAGTDDDLRSWE